MPDYDYIRKELLCNGVSKKLLWTEYMEDCRANGEEPLMYSQFCYHIQQDEQKHRATMHINRKPGEQVEVDWAGDPATIIDEKRKNVFIVDDSLFSRTSCKKTELGSKVFDHTDMRFKKGFRMLTLSWSDGNTLIPVNSCLLASAKDTNIIRPVKAIVLKKYCIKSRIFYDKVNCK